MDEKVHVAYAGLGSNLPDGALKMINKAINEIGLFGHLKAVSNVYTTRPVNPKVNGDNDYCNAVVMFEVTFPLDELLIVTKSLEAHLGRNGIKGCVGIDIDVVIWNDEILRPTDFEREYFQIGYQQILSRCRKQD